MFLKKKSSTSTMMKSGMDSLLKFIILTVTQKALSNSTVDTLCRTSIQSSSASSVPHTLPKSSTSETEYKTSSSHFKIRDYKFKIATVISINWYKYGRTKI